MDASLALAEMQAALLPKPLESRRIGRRVLHGVLDIAVPKVILNEPGIGSLIG